MNIRTRSKVSKKKKIVSGDVWPEDESLVKIEEGKCLIVKPTWPYSRESLDDSLGLIAVLLLNGIYKTKNEYIRPSTTVYENDKHPEELVFEFDKKYTEKIKKIEIAYHMGKSEICAIDMCRALLTVLSSLGVTNPKHLVSKYNIHKL